MTKNTKSDDKIVEEAKKRFERCKDHEATARARFIEDVKFAEGDADNQYQWEWSIRNKRLNAQGGPRPCLTINKVRQCNLQIINDERENKAQIEVRPVGDGATYEAAKIYEGICRHIEYISNAQAAYDTASWFQIYGGIGYWRVLTDYSGPQSFDQEIFIRRIGDPMSVYLDPDIQQYDGSDARFGFIFRDIPKDEFENEYPEWKDEVGDEAIQGDEGPVLSQRNDWVDKDHVRVAEYYRKTDKEDRLLQLSTAQTVLKSDLPDGVYERPEFQAAIQAERATYRAKVEWFKVAGSHIIERADWPGEYIPIVRVVGEETLINGELDRKGHTRALKDSQRMLNYWSSSAAEHIALQSKAPWIGQKDAFEGLEGEWNNANNENKPYLAYNGYDENGRQVPAPERTPPPVFPQAYMQGWQSAQQDMMMASGQFQSQFGENENAKSGIAIQTRQRQGDKATYHYIDHLAQAIRFTGRILIDLIPKIYDTPRVIKIMAEDGDQSEVHVQPDAPRPQMQVGPNGQPLSSQQVEQMQAQASLADQIKTIFNPNVGKYDVEADIGPAYATRRQETFNALSQMMAQNAELTKIAGDLLFKAADFPMADEVAERFKRTIPPNILGQGPDPNMQQMQQQNQMLQNSVAMLNQQLQTAQAQVKRGMDDAEIKVYDAETRRISAMNQIDPEALKPIVRELVSQVLGTPILPIMDAHAQADQARMPQPAPEAPETVQ